MDNLKLNRETGKYEVTLVLTVDAEIFRRMVFRHIEENNIDVTDVEAYQKAVASVARASNWLNHPHAVIGSRCEMPTAVVPPATPIQPKEDRPVTSNHKKLNVQEKEALQRRALDLPVDQWETLLTPLVSLPRGEGGKEKNDAYKRRYAEREVLNKLRKELETPLNMERVGAIAGAIKANGIH